MLVTIALICFVAWLGVTTLVFALCRAAAAGDRGRRPTEPAPCVPGPGLFTRLRRALPAGRTPPASPTRPAVPGH